MNTSAGNILLSMQAKTYDTSVYLKSFVKMVDYGNLCQN